MTLEELACRYRYLEELLDATYAPAWLLEGLGWPGDSKIMLDVCVVFNKDDPYFLFEERTEDALYGKMHMMAADAWILEDVCNPD
jgi:hypothetical protein